MMFVNKLQIVRNTYITDEQVRSQIPTNLYKNSINLYYSHVTMYRLKGFRFDKNLPVPIYQRSFEFDGDLTYFIFNNTQIVRKRLSKNGENSNDI